MCGMREVVNKVEKESCSILLLTKRVQNMETKQ
jgi:hypothetical protein